MFLTYFLHTSNEKQWFFMFFLWKSNVFLTFLIRKRSNAIIVTPNAFRASARAHSKDVLLLALPQELPPETQKPGIFDIRVAYV